MFLYGYLGYMKKANISYTKNHLSELLHLVREGESVLIVDRKTPIAKIEPVTYSIRNHSAWLADKVRKGLLSEPRQKKTASPLAGWKPVRSATGADALDALNQDREDRV